jgi:hypothetical protein
MFSIINPENGWGMISSKTLVTFYQTIQYYAPEIRVMQVCIIFSSLVLLKSIVLLPALCHFQSYSISGLKVLPASCYFQSHVTPSIMLLSTLCYFQPRGTSSFMVLPTSWYFKPRVTATLMLLPTSLLSASYYFLKFRSKHSSQHPVTNVLKTNHLLLLVYSTKLSTDKTRMPKSDTQYTTVATRKRANTRL